MMAQPTLPQLAAIVSNLVDTVSTLQTEVSTLRTELQYLKNHQTGPQNAEPRPAPVSPFSGDPRLGRGFLAQCEVNFNLQPSRFGTDGARVGFVASALSSRALDWYTAIATRTPAVCHSYDLFRERFSAVFCLPDGGEDAAVRLTRLVQGNKSVADYAVDFQVLAAQCAITDDSMRGTFYAGLNSDIQEGLVNQYPRNFADLVQLAIRVDARRADLRGNHARAKPRFSSPPNWSRSEPMEIGLTNTPSVDKRRGQFKRHVCAYCGKTGHTAMKCFARERDEKEKNDEAH